jgi:hypothetical protein
MVSGRGDRSDTSIRRPRWLTPRTAEAAPYILAIMAPDQESRHWLKVAGAVLGVLLLPVGRALGSQTGSRLSLRMISFNSLVALVISCSSTATAWRFPGGAAREPSRSSTLITYSTVSMAPKGPSASIRTRELRVRRFRAVPQ